MTQGSLPNPRRDRLHPRPWHADYIQLRAVAVQLKHRISTRWPPGSAIRVADIGCRDRPYEPLFRGRAREYVGVDLAAGPTVDVVAEADDLPFPDGSFDCVLATQMLQLTPDPSKAVREFHRVLAPGGTLFLSTLGVGFADRSAVDRWRWTHEGLRSLLAGAGSWDDVEISPAGGVLSASAYLLGGQAEFASHHLGLARLAAPFCFTLNVVAWRADMLVKRRFPHLPPDASVSYLATALAR